MIAFIPTSALLGFTAAATAPTSVKVSCLDGTQSAQVCLTNIDPSNDAVIGWGASDAEAKLNAAAPATSCSCYYLLRGSQVVISAKSEAFFTGIAISGTAAIKVQAGHGL